jgi:hypothetical protein
VVQVLQYSGPLELKRCEDGQDLKEVLDGSKTTTRTASTTQQSQQDKIPSPKLAAGTAYNNMRSTRIRADTYDADTKCTQVKPLLAQIHRQSDQKGECYGEHKEQQPRRIRTWHTSTSTPVCVNKVKQSTTVNAT